MHTNSLIDIFRDHVVNRKSLKDYVEIRKDIHERGEFNDASLLRAEELLQCVKTVDSESYESLYKTLDEIIRLDDGNAVEYPIDFVREILKIGKNGMTAREVAEEYRRTLDHHFHAFKHE